VIPFKPDKNFIPQVGDVFEIKHSYDKVTRRHLLLEINPTQFNNIPMWRCKFLSMSDEGFEKTHFKTIAFGGRNNSLMCVARVAEE
jgi:hypothetical protein